MALGLTRSQPAGSAPRSCHAAGSPMMWLSSRILRISRSSFLRIDVVQARHSCHKKKVRRPKIAAMIQRIIGPSASTQFESCASKTPSIWELLARAPRIRKMAVSADPIAVPMRYCQREATICSLVRGS